MRLFIGVPIPESLREELAALSRAWRERGPALKWVDPSLYHLTLQFLGEMADETRAALTEVLAGLKTRPAFTLRLGAPMTLPPGRGARVLALSLADGFEDLRALAEAVMSRTRDCGIPREKRPYRAHLTLARARRGERLPAALALESLEGPEFASWEVGAFHLFQSVLRPDGPIYRSRLRVDLKG